MPIRESLAQQRRPSVAKINKLKGKNKLQNYYEKDISKETIKKILYIMFNSKASIIVSLDEILENNLLFTARLSEITSKR